MVGGNDNIFDGGMLIVSSHFCEFSARSQQKSNYDPVLPTGKDMESVLPLTPR